MPHWSHKQLLFSPCSAFDRFLELFQQYRQTGDAGDTDPDDSLPAPGSADYLDENGFINPEFSLPATFIATHMPQLKVLIRFCVCVYVRLFVCCFSVCSNVCQL